MPDDVEGQLNQALRDYEARTSNQVAVAVVRTTGDRSIEEYSLDLARTWGIGTEDSDNGVLLLIAHDQRRLRIEVGLGLEGVLPDTEAQRIIDTHIVPLLQRGDVGAAVVAGTTAIRGALGDPDVGKPQQDAVQPRTAVPSDGDFGFETIEDHSPFHGTEDDDPFSAFVPFVVVAAVIGVVSSLVRGGSGRGGGRRSMFFGTGWEGHHARHHAHHSGGFFGGGFSGGSSGGGSISSRGSSSGGGGGGGSFGGGGASGSW